ncbi:hypothetical protein TNCV_3233911 [Trichonephila clavipes]|nr:hypothetical protein TNCV_3233911 [Trichonephila clavipes]
MEINKNKYGSIVNEACLNGFRGYLSIKEKSGKLHELNFLRNLKLHVGDSTIFLDSTPKLEEESPGGGQGTPTSLLLPPTTREDLWLDGYLE